MSGGSVIKHNVAYPRMVLLGELYSLGECGIRCNSDRDQQVCVETQVVSDSFGEDPVRNHMLGVSGNNRKLSPYKPGLVKPRDCGRVQRS